MFDETLENVQYKIDRNIDLAQKLIYRILENISDFAQLCEVPEENLLTLADIKSKREIRLPKDFYNPMRRLICARSRLKKVQEQIDFSVQNFTRHYPEISKSK